MDNVPFYIIVNYEYNFGPEYLSLDSVDEFIKNPEADLPKGLDDIELSTDEKVSLAKELSDVLGAELQKASYDKADGDVIFVQTN